VAGARQLLDAARAVLYQYPPEAIRRILHVPLFLVSAPRAGSTLLFELLMKTAGFWTIGGESHGVFRAFPHLHAANAELDSGALNESNADIGTMKLLPACFLALLQNHRQQAFMALPPEERPARLTFLEKTPRNALNIPFLLAVFPDARFIYLYRDPRENIASLIEAWKAGLGSGRFVTFRGLPGWDRPSWCFLLPPGWRRFTGKTLPEIAAFQWTAGNTAILDNLAALPRGRYRTMSYRQLTETPAAAVAALSNFAGVPTPSGTCQLLPLSRTSLTPPHPDKWKSYEREIATLWPVIDTTWQRIQAFCA